MDDQAKSRVMGVTNGQSGLLIVDDNADALAVRMLAAREAASSLDMMYYMWHDDQSGRLLARELLAAAERGVKVRVLIDDINPQKSDAHYLALDSHPNIVVKLFNPSGLRNGSLFRWAEMVLRVFAMTRRMHAKAWIADREVAIVGGRNIADEYFGAASTNFRDLDMVMRGKAVADTSAIFERFWNHHASRPVKELNPGVIAGLPESAVAKPGDEAALMDGAGTLDEFVAARGGLTWCEHVSVLSDPPDKVKGKDGRSWLMRELRPKLMSTRQRLEIVSPYFIPGRKGTALLGGVIRRGGSVAVLTNSLATTDVAAVHGAYANYRKKLLNLGVELYEFQPSSRQRKMSLFGSKGASLHTKSFTIDDRIGFIGSMNFDPRSVALNAEMGVVFEDPGLVQKLREHFAAERDPDVSYRLSIRRNLIHWHRAEGERIVRTGREPKASIPRRLLARVVRWLPVESQL
jgi:putative cardiolipin synthase